VFIAGGKRQYSGEEDDDSASKRARGSGPHIDLRILLPSRV